MKIKVKLSKAQRSHVFDAIDSKTISEFVDLGKTVMTLNVRDYNDLCDEIMNHFGDLAAYEGWELDHEEHAGRGEFTQRQYERCENALFEKMNTSLEGVLDDKIRLHTGFDGIEGLREECGHMTPTLRLTEENDDWMPALHRWMDEQGMKYSKE